MPRFTQLILRRHTILPANPEAHKYYFRSNIYTGGNSKATKINLRRSSGSGAWAAASEEEISKLRDTYTPFVEQSWNRTGSLERPPERPMVGGIKKTVSIELVSRDRFEAEQIVQPIV